MSERTKLDELFMAQALGRGLLSSVQIHRLMEEVKRRRATRPSIFAHDVAVDLKLLTLDVALSLLRSEPVQQTLIGSGPELEAVRTLIAAPRKPEAAKPAGAPIQVLPPQRDVPRPVDAKPLVTPQREVPRPEPASPLTWDGSTLPKAPPAEPPRPLKPAPGNERMPSLFEPARPASPSLVYPAVSPRAGAAQPLEPTLEPVVDELQNPAALSPSLAPLDPETVEDSLIPTMLEAPGPRRVPPSVSSQTSRETPVPIAPTLLEPVHPSPVEKHTAKVPQPAPLPTMLEPARLGAARKASASDTERVQRLEPTMLESPVSLKQDQKVPVRSSMPETPVLKAELARSAQPQRPPSMVEPMAKTEPPKAPAKSADSTAGTGPGSGADLRAGLGSGSKLGIESDVTDADHFQDTKPEKDSENTDIFGAEMTIAQLREKKGLGDGIQLDDRAERLKNATRARFGDVAHRRYKVLREIARGGMGKVLEVIDADLRRPVALKVLRSEMLENKDIVERFLEEAQITGQLEHPNIVPVHEIGVDARKNLYFTMKLVEGMDLATIFQKLSANDPETVKTYTLSKLLDIFIKVCEGVHFAHSKGVIHRDLKPPNIMVGRFGEVQIMDWGIARIVGSRAGMESRRTVMTDRREDETGQTMVGTIVGTPTHMSPEQARGETVTLKPSSDIFSLGVILYEMLTLKLPWAGRQVKLVLDQILNLNPQSPMQAAPEKNVPPELDALCMKCLVKDPENRIQTPKELIDNLRTYIEGGTMAAVQYSFAQLFSKWLARNKTRVITAALILVALIGSGSGVWWVIREQERSQIPVFLDRGQQAATEASANLDRHEFSPAREKAAEAFSNFTRVLEIDNDDAAAKKGAEEMSVLRGKIASEEESWARTEQDRRKREQDDRDKAERERKLNAGLEIARARLKEADAAFNGDQYTKEVRKAYDSARDAYKDVQRVDETNKEALDRVVRIDAWMANYDKQIKITEQLSEIRRLLEGSREVLEKAIALEGFKDARPLLQDAIRRCDGALGIGNDLDEAAPLHKQVADVKARATLDFARRALQIPQFEFCAYMLDQAADTHERQSEVKALREKLEFELKRASDFSKLYTSAEAAFNEAQAAGDIKKWEVALQKVREADAESSASRYATDTEKVRLSQWLQICQLEPVGLRDTKAANVDDMTSVEAEYAALLAGVLKDDDYRARAIAQRLDLRNRLLNALRAEAARSRGQQAREFLRRAMGYVADENQKRELDMLLEDVAAREAIGELDAKMALLPRGSFLLGSTRESDGNPQRLFEHKSLVFVDKYLVTNADYKAFMDAGAYESIEGWEDTPRDLLAAFVDSTGKPGPSGWSDGGFDATLANMPVTGISWYEARAFAVWAGKRLPTIEEWEIAAGAPRTDKDEVTEFPFGSRDDAIKTGGVKSLREVGTAEWDKNLLSVRDLGCNGAEWTGSMHSNGRALFKGSEPGLKIELFLRFARRVKNSSAPLADRSSGRGFRCVRDFKFQ